MEKSKRLTESVFHGVPEGRAMNPDCTVQRGIKSITLFLLKKEEKKNNYVGTCDAHTHVNIHTHTEV